MTKSVQIDFNDWVAIKKYCAERNVTLKVFFKEAIARAVRERKQEVSK